MSQGSGGGNGHGEASSGPVSDNVRARRFELVDAKGEVRAVLGTQADNGAPGFLVSDSAGRPRVALHVSPDDAPAFDLLDATGALACTSPFRRRPPVLTPLFGATENPVRAADRQQRGAAHLAAGPGRRPHAPVLLRCSPTGRRISPSWTEKAGPSFPARPARRQPAS
jgi:hypothetical protein